MLGTCLKASRISTSLHQSKSNPADDVRVGRLLLGMVVPGHLIFNFAIMMSGASEAEVTGGQFGLDSPIELSLRVACFSSTCNRQAQPLCNIIPNEVLSLTASAPLPTYNLRKVLPTIYPLDKDLCVNIFSPLNLRDFINVWSF